MAGSVLASIDRAALGGCCYVDPNDSSLLARPPLRGVFSLKYTLYWAYSVLAKAERVAVSFHHDLVGYLRQRCVKR